MERAEIERIIFEYDRLLERVKRLRGDVNGPPHGVEVDEHTRLFIDGGDMVVCNPDDGGHLTTDRTIFPLNLLTMSPEELASWQREEAARIEAETQKWKDVRQRESWERGRLEYLRLKQIYEPKAPTEAKVNPYLGMKANKP